MASGKSLELRYMTRDAPIQERDTKARNRQLNGKERIKVRKYMNKWFKRVMEAN